MVEFSDEEVLATTRKLRVGYELKRTLRYRTKRDFEIHSESDAEHIFALIYLAYYFLKTEPSGTSLNVEKINNLILFHEFGEIKHGDVVTYDKTNEDKKREARAAKEIFESLPEPLDKEGYEFWLEYEAQQTPEARFCFALDKIEPLFELFDPVNQESMKNLQVTYEMNLSNKLRPTEEFPVMRRFVEVLSKDMLDRGVFWSA